LALPFIHAGAPFVPPLLTNCGWTKTLQNPLGAASQASEASSRLRWRCNLYGERMPRYLRVVGWTALFWIAVLGAIVVLVVETHGPPVKLLSGAKLGL